ncbi:MAG: hypothetical protein ACI91Z_002082 [Yoonia sp.]|jgi:hypothetical protein
MNTPAHLIFGIAAFGNSDKRGVTAAALTGAMIPDLSLYLLSGWELLVQGTSPTVVFGQMYYSESWQSIFRIDNSFVLWGLLLVVGLMARSGVLVALCGAALMHLALDFPLHNDDARAHFWPLTNWKFVSPVSYWNPKYYGHIVGPIEVGLVLLASVYAWRKFKGRVMRGGITIVALLELAPIVMFVLMFDA